MTGTTSELVNRMQAGDIEARNEIVAHTCERLARLTRRMLRGYPGVRRWLESDDVFHNSLVRLDRALKASPPESAQHFYKLAALQIRRELLDLANQFRGKFGIGQNHFSDKASRILSGEADKGDEPSSLAAWTEFHKAVDSLPDSEREVFGLLWYQGISQQEAADVLGISLRTVKRRWLDARLSLGRTFEQDSYV